MFGIRFVFVEKVHAKTTSSRTEIIDIKAYTKVRKMRSADDAQIRCEYSLEYGEAIDIIRHRLMRFLSRVSCAQDLQYKVKILR